MFLIWLMVSLFGFGIYFLLIAIGTGQTKHRRAVYFTVLAYSFVAASIAYGAPVLTTHVVWMIAFSLLLLITAMPPVWAMSLACLLFLLGCVWASWDAVRLLRIDEQYQARFPVHSLSDRLDYEQTVMANHEYEQITHFDPDRLNDFRVAHQRHLERSRALERIHRSAVNRFISSPGFGVFRFPEFGPEWIDELDAAPSIPLPSEYAIRKSSTPFPDHLTTPPAADWETEVPSSESAEPSVPHQALWETHLDSAGDFVNEGSVGYVEDIEHVSGFLAHGFREMPTIDRQDSEKTATRWRLTQLQLVSLLKHPEPAVYNSSELPRMDALKDISTRR
ncbi:MAG: hypothetical protein CMJ46_13865, partial [Planctomyces sp.]|nr:hypothetical protein [Planctomyces sp.]